MTSVPRQRVPVLGHQPCRAGPRGHVKVVTAGVHHRRGLPGGVLHHHVLANGQPGLLFHRERVEFGAQHDRRPGAVPEHGDDPRLAHAGRDVEPERLHARGQFGGRLCLLKSELRCAMEVDVERVDVWKDRVDFCRALESSSAGRQTARRACRRSRPRPRDCGQPSIGGRSPTSQVVSSEPYPRYFHPRSHRSARRRKLESRLTMGASTADDDVPGLIGLRHESLDIGREHEAFAHEI